MSLGNLFTVIFGSQIILDCNILPANSFSISCNKVLCEGSHIFFSTLLWEAKTHACLKSICKLSLTTSCELYCTCIITLDCGENVLGISCICQARAVIGPLTKIPAIKQGIKDRSKVWETKNELIDGLITVKSITVNVIVVWITYKV